MREKHFGLLAVGSFLILSAAAVWLGGLNQDEGWYVYAANLVNEGKMPYRDFFYTQGPLMPMVYASFAFVWKSWGLLGARLLTLVFGAFAILTAVALARSYVEPAKRAAVSVVVFLLLGSNLYHLYYTAIPKTYALASLFVAAGFLALRVARTSERSKLALFAGLALAFAAGTRISLGALLAVVGTWLLVMRRFRALAWFCLGGFGGLALVYGPFLADPEARLGLLAAQAYHAVRGGFDPVFTVGSVSRLVRWYLPVFIVFGLGVGKCLVPGAWCLVQGAHQAPSTKYQAPSASILLFGFLAVFLVQMLAPFPYEDYQVPVMGLLAVYAAVNFISRYCKVQGAGCAPSTKHQAPSTNNAPSTKHQAPATHQALASLLLVLGLCFANSFGSPLLEKWMTNGQDRFWSLKKSKSELAQLRETARKINELDPDGKTLLTQDLYLAIETDRKVPDGLEMGPFAILDDDGWRRLLRETDCPVAALSGYSFAIRPPVCDERPVEQQLEFFRIVKARYELAFEEPAFGQNATTLLVLKRK